MIIVADAYRFVIGVDTHAKTHTLAVIATGPRRLVDTARFPTSPAGLARAMSWIARRTDATRVGALAVLEGTGSYGARLAERLTAAGYRVVEAPTPRRDAGTGKTDALDAVAAAEGVLHLPVDRLREWRAGQAGRAAQVLLTARENLTGERTAKINALTAVVRTHDLGIDAREPLTTTQVRTIAAWRPRTGEPVHTATARAEATRLARRIRQLDTEIRDNLARLRDLTTQHVPTLLAAPGIGPASAARALATWSRPGRIRSADALAKLAGTAPIPASSGNTENMRLSRGGDRRLNSAIHTIAIWRMAHDPQTRTWVAKQRAQGKTTRATRRLLKRYITREIFKHLNNSELASPLDRS